MVDCFTWLAETTSVSVFTVQVYESAIEHTVIHKEALNTALLRSFQLLTHVVGVFGRIFG